MCGEEIKNCAKCGKPFGSQNDDVFCFVDDKTGRAFHFCSESCWEDWLVAREQTNIWHTKVVEQ